MQCIDEWNRRVHACVEKLPDGHLWSERYHEATTENGKQRIAEAVYFFATGIAGPTVRGPTCEIGAKLNIGHSPASMFPELTKSEAAAFVSQEWFVTPLDWFWNELLTRHPEIEEAGAARTSHISVARWLERILETSPQRKDALFRSRESKFGEEHIEGNALQRLDELSPDDLCESVNETFARSVTRMAREEWGGPDELIRPPTWESELPSGVKLLRHSVELYMEGREMHHCAGTYCESVYNGENFLFSICHEGKRATALTDTSGRIIQVVGFANSTADPECRILAKSIVQVVR